MASLMFPVISRIDQEFSFRNLYNEKSDFISLKLNCFGNIDLKWLGPCEKDLKL